VLHHFTKLVTGNRRTEWHEHATRPESRQEGKTLRQDLDDNTTLYGKQ
jgi:hypothetical protein